MYRTVPIFVIIINLATNFTNTYVSFHNYSGGYALHDFHRFIPKEKTNYKVHIDTATAMTGASRFGQTKDNVEYIKREDHKHPNDFKDY